MIVTHVAVLEPSYIARYPDGRELVVAEAQAIAHAGKWQTEGVQVFCVLTRRQAPIFDGTIHR
jgi:hypothetical protein